MTWQTKTLGDLTKLIKDGTHGSHKDVKNGIPLLSAKDINSGKIHITSDARRISQDDFDAIHKNYKLKDGDVLLTIVGTLGRIAVIRNYKSDYTLQRSVSILRFKDFVSPYFVQYVLYSENFQKDLLRRESKGAQGGVYLGDIAKIKISIPDLAEQERIVGVLEVWDNYLEKLERKIELKEMIKQAITKKIFNNKNGKWPRKKISSVADFINGYIFKSTDYDEKGTFKVITIANVQSGNMIIGDETNSVIDIPQDIQDEQILEIGDMLISMTGNVGRVCFVNSNNCLLNQRVGKILPKLINKEFLYHQINNSNFISDMIRQSQGGAQDNLSVKAIVNYEIFIPTRNEQKQSAEILTTCDNEIATLKSKKHQIQQQKKFLLKNLVSGTIRTPEDILEKGSVCF